MHVAVILAGGCGSRLYPLSSKDIPKQFLKLGSGDYSLFQEALQRALKVTNHNNIIIVTSVDYLDITRNQISEIAPISACHVVLEPQAKNTAPAILLASLYALDNFASPVLWIMPSDHLMDCGDGFYANIKDCMNSAADGNIITFGIRPVTHEGRYGHIIAKGNDGQLCEVDSFIEKPHGEKLNWCMSQDSVFWNSGMFLVAAHKIIREVQKYDIDLFDKVEKSYNKASIYSGCLLVDGKCYNDIDAIAIDRLVIERSGDVLVKEIKDSWSDIGSWHALWQLSQGNKDFSDPLKRFLYKIKKAMVV